MDLTNKLFRISYNTGLAGLGYLYFEDSGLYLLSSFPYSIPSLHRIDSFNYIYWKQKVESIHYQETPLEILLTSESKELWGFARERLPFFECPQA